MTPIQERELRDALLKAFIRAIETVGFDAFKATSMFMSNRKKPLFLGKGAA